MQDLPALLTPDFGLLFWMLLAFTVVFVILKKWGFPVILKAVEDRKQFIDESLKNAREANEKLANIQAECETLLKQAHDQQAQILKDASDTRSKMIQQAKDEAILEGKKMIEDARNAIHTERENALRSIRSQVATLSVQIAEKILQQQLQNPSQQEQLIDQILQDIKE
ncbi:MAG: F0F1 ATP synthase subunit B [Alloprevotella sp.]|nr:F0F1 ATP synthase subunit B [Bacteroidales bacterium]MDY3943866.1 F0F1 ATP synthase subunit B [Alloprevotella sp.]